MDGKVANGDRQVAAIAARQHGVVSISQLRHAGVTEDAVRRRVRSGRLHRVHRGVYSVGHVRLSREGIWMAAVLACRGCAVPGDDRFGCRLTSRDGWPNDRWSTAEAGSLPVLSYWGATLSHRSAAALWGLLPVGTGSVDVSVPSGGGRARRRGIRLHRRPSLLPADVTLRSGIPVTTPARTIADLRRSASGRSPLISARELRRAIRQAEVLGLPIGPAPERDRTRSELERDFLRLCRRHRLPAPEVNVRVGRHLVDFLWRERRLVVETDGFRYHRGRSAFEDDRQRDLELRAQGYELLRLSARQVSGEAGRVAEVLRQALR